MNIREAKVLYGIVIVVSMAIVFVPIRNTVTLASKYFRLRAAAAGQARMSGQSDDQKTWRFRRTPLHGTADVFDNISSAVQHHAVIINRFDAPQTFVADRVEVQSQSVILEGGFGNILESLQTVADSLGDVRLASVGFRREERAKKSVLLARVVFQSATIQQDHE